MSSEIPHTQVPYHVATSQLNFDKIQITGFRNTRDNRARNLRTGSSNKVNKSELKGHPNDGKSHAKCSWKTLTTRVS